MLAPLSWLKDYVDITLPSKELGDRMTEIGLGTEKILKEGADTIFELEITPNRPDLLSIIGVAREIAALEKKKIKLPKTTVDVTKVKSKQTLPITIKANTKLSPRFTGIVIKGVTVKDSPEWLKVRLVKIGQRPINNIVDITNYVMFELGNPLHAFDYDKITNHTMQIEQTTGGESFKSVDGISYHLPKGAVVVTSDRKIIDLCGIKGAESSGTFGETKNLFVWAPVEDPLLIRRASRALGLRSDASSIFERGVNRGGTIEALNRCVDLILEAAGGEIASEMIDVKAEDFKPWKLDLRVTRLNKILGIEIPEKKVLEILESLNLQPKMKQLSNKTIVCAIPTYRNDLKIEEDLIEEVARLYGYNNFPKTLPSGNIPTKPVPYSKDYSLDAKIKNLMTAAGFSESYTYSLISEADLVEAGINPNHAIRVDNPVSREFEYLRPTLKPNLRIALRINEANFLSVNLFELGKVYLGNTIDKAEEEYVLAGISNKKNFFEVKGLLEKVYETLGITENPSKEIEVLDEGVFFEINYSQILKNLRTKKVYKVFKPLPKYPPIIEDLALILPESAATGETIAEITRQSPLVAHVDLLDEYQNSRTFHIIYQHRERNLTTAEVAKIREKILKTLKEKFGARVKE